MNKSRLPVALLTMFALLSVTPASFAGSKRWIVAMTPERMIQEKLIHVRFLKPDGVALESDALKKMVIREQNCSTGHPLEIANDYKMGYAPVGKLIGIYLPPKAWQNKALCFSVPGIGKVERSLTAADNDARSVVLNVTP